MRAATDAAAGGRSLIVHPIARVESFGLSAGRGDPSQKHRVLDDAFPNPDFRSLLGLGRGMIAVDNLPQAARCVRGANGVENVIERARHRLAW